MARRLITGDIHGCYQTLKSLFERKINITKQDKLYFVGDFIDRGPASREVLDYLIDLKWRGFSILPVQGNHEDMLLNALKDESNMYVWLNNGAEYTLQSFDVPGEMIYDYDSIFQIPERYIQFIESMPYYLEEENFLLCHAGLNFETEDPLQDTSSMLWIRDFHYNPDKISGHRLIHGHTPVPLADLDHNLRDKNSNVINLDTGCVYKGLPGYGNLIAFDPDASEYYQQENIDL